MTTIDSFILQAVFKQIQPAKSVIPVYTADGEFDCSICLEKVTPGQKIRILPCSDTVNHKFHQQCIDHWFKNNNTCPMCRAKMW